MNKLVACARSRYKDTGNWVHSCVCQLGCDPFESNLNFNVILATAIMDMYAKCGNLRYTRDLFNNMPKEIGHLEFHNWCLHSVRLCSGGIKSIF